MLHRNAPGFVAAKADEGFELHAQHAGATSFEIRCKAVLVIDVENASSRVLIRMPGALQPPVGSQLRGAEDSRPAACMRKLGAWSSEHHQENAHTEAHTPCHGRHLGLKILWRSAAA